MNNATTRFMMLIAVAAALTTGGCASPPTKVSTREQLRSTEGERIALQGTIVRTYGKGRSSSLAGEFGEIEMVWESGGGFDDQKVEIVGRVLHGVREPTVPDGPFSPLKIPQAPLIMEPTGYFFLHEIESIRAIGD